MNGWAKKNQRKKTENGNTSQNKHGKTSKINPNDQNVHVHAC